VKTEVSDSAATVIIRPHRSRPTT